MHRRHGQKIDKVSSMMANYHHPPYDYPYQSSNAADHPNDSPASSRSPSSYAPNASPRYYHHHRPDRLSYYPCRSSSADRCPSDRLFLRNRAEDAPCGAVRCCHGRRRARPCFHGRSSSSDRCPSDSRDFRSLSVPVREVSMVGLFIAGGPGLEWVGHASHRVISWREF
jgi:hypothetical protein